MNKIKNIYAREILDSRGNPTIEVDIYLENGIVGRGVSPSGSSTGSKEALELRDQDKSRYHGMGVLKAIKSVGLIKKELIGLNVVNHYEIDKIMIELDGTKDKSKLGANAILAISIAAAKAAAQVKKESLFYFLSKDKNFKMPIPMMNIINGGAHANNMIDIQEFMIVPINDELFSDRVRKGSEIFHQLKKNLSKRKLGINVGDEGGFAANIDSTENAIEIILESANEVGYRSGKDVLIALDVAASELYEGDIYNFARAGKKYDVAGMISYYKKLIDDYPICSIEDPFDENDYQGWQQFTALMRDKVTIVGDDIFVTNPEIFKDGIDKNIANAILIKPNQIGTLYETFEAINIAKKNNYKTIMSHRSGETEDTTISHLSVGYNTDMIKTGSLSRTDRVAKYNELIRIEEEIKSYQ